MSTKLKCYQNWNVTKTEMLPKLKCYQILKCPKNLNLNENQNQGDRHWSHWSCLYLKQVYADGLRASQREWNYVNSLGLLTTDWIRSGSHQLQQLHAAYTRELEKSQLTSSAETTLVKCSTQPHLSEAPGGWDYIILGCLSICHTEWRIASRIHLKFFTVINLYHGTYRKSRKV